MNEIKGKSPPSKEAKSLSNRSPLSLVQAENLLPGVSNMNSDPSMTKVHPVNACYQFFNPPLLTKRNRSEKRFSHDQNSFEQPHKQRTKRSLSNEKGTLDRPAKKHLMLDPITTGFDMSKPTAEGTVQTGKWFFETLPSKKLTLETVGKVINTCSREDEKFQTGVDFSYPLSYVYPDKEPSEKPQRKWSYEASPNLKGCIGVFNDSQEISTFLLDKFGPALNFITFAAIGTVELFHSKEYVKLQGYVVDQTCENVANEKDFKESIGRESVNQRAIGAFVRQDKKLFLLVVMLFDALSEEQGEEFYDLLVPIIRSPMSWGYRRECKTTKYCSKALCFCNLLGKSISWGCGKHKHLNQCKFKGEEDELDEEENGDVSQDALTVTERKQFKLFLPVCKSSITKSMDKEQRKVLRHVADIEKEEVRYYQKQLRTQSHHLADKCASLLEVAAPKVFKEMSQQGSVGCSIGKTSTCFSSITVGSNFACAPHIDTNDIKAGLSLVVTLTRPNLRGQRPQNPESGQMQFLPHYRVRGPNGPVAAFAHEHRSIIIECGGIVEHATTLIQKQDMNQPARLFAVLYRHNYLNQPNHGQGSNEPVETSMGKDMMSLFQAWKKENEILAEGKKNLEKTVSGLRDREREKSQEIEKLKLKKRKQSKEFEEKETNWKKKEKSMEEKETNWKKKEKSMEDAQEKLKLAFQKELSKRQKEWEDEKQDLIAGLRQKQALMDALSVSKSDAASQTPLSHSSDKPTPQQQIEEEMQPELLFSNLSEKTFTCAFCSSRPAEHFDVHRQHMIIRHHKELVVGESCKSCREVHIPNLDYRVQKRKRVQGEPPLIQCFCFAYHPDQTSHELHMMICHHQKKYIDERCKACNQIHLPTDKW